LYAEERKLWGDPSRGEPKNPEKWQKTFDAVDRYGKLRLAQHDVIDRIEKKMERYLEWRIEERVAWARARAEGCL
jgi:hypothetical protein